MDPKYQWLASRISHQQGIKYKNLLDIRLKYSEALRWGSLDLIKGKGTGLFILLHGVPGIGKTVTVEAIGQANGKPLFKTTIGDLGMIPERLEISLREKFHLASIWDYILLLDAANTFCVQRFQADMVTIKNALVSVFLPGLDYYYSILFLTTNRASVLDEAFKSRIHYKIYYPDLTLEQTLDIWKLNINRVRRIEEGSESCSVRSAIARIQRRE
ncbi:P-loop containing nucleoside triphosphate hydrolase protein, partial [Leptodontidium sp. MPI-SDFR-AT-0119]